MNESAGRYGRRVGYTVPEREKFAEGGLRVRQGMRLPEAATSHAIDVEVVAARNCNPGHAKGGGITNGFRFMRYVRCPDAGLDCLGYGEATAQVRVVPRERA